MQIWIYFQPGAGGDGFANLIEQCKQITKFDDHCSPWRIHRFVDNQPKFFAPAIDLNHHFRQHPEGRFSLQNNELVQSYVDCVLQNKNIVCTSHHVELLFSKVHDCQEILTKDLIRVLITCSDTKHSWHLATIKNLSTTAVESILDKPLIVDLNQYDYVLEIDQIHSDWNYVQKFCRDVDLELSESAYRDYQAILAGSTKFDPYAPRYKSSIIDGVLSYSKIN